METYHRRKSEGVCAYCGEQPPKDGSVNCKECSLKSSKRSCKKAKSNRAKGLCRCGNVINDFHTYCKSCIDRKKEWYEDRKRNGICQRCPNPVKPKHFYCKDHLLWIRLRGIDVLPSEKIKAKQAVESFNGVCQNPNCFATTPGMNDKKDWHIDHCHIKKIFRGILCGHCNTLLGCARDSVHILAGAIEYLERFQ